MKLTVRFGSVCVVVPCGDGTDSVHDLMTRAAVRFRKATAQSDGTWVTVHSLKTCDGGILDGDDLVRDVTDDRDQLLALYETSDSQQLERYMPGDGASTSDDGCRSPVQLMNGDHRFQPFSQVDIEVTAESDHAGSLQVRRGSESALNQIEPSRLAPVVPQPPHHSCKRWSAAPIIDDDIQARSTPIQSVGSFDQLTLPGEEYGPGYEKDRLGVPFTRFSGDSTRLSTQLFGNSGSWRWADAADKVLTSRRWEPVGDSNASADVSYEDEQVGFRELVLLTNVVGPLGIHAVPECDVSGKESGLRVQRVETDGLVHADGRIRVGDKIVEINGLSLHNVTFQRAQEIFLSAVGDGELRLLVDHADGRPSQQLPAAPRLSRVATVSPTKKVPPPSLSSRTQTVMLTSNTRKLGRRLNIRLLKGASGLGFSLTTRDNPAVGQPPIYIKNILPQGAAIEDGRLRCGDRLLEVDGMTGLSQQQVVERLRAVRSGDPVELVVSRHEPVNSTAVDQQPPEQSCNSDAVTTNLSPILPMPAVSVEAESTKDKEILVFDIPVHDSERAGLGVSVKGKTTAGMGGPIDAGIFIKSVICGGAASKDGRLQRNDQLIQVNSCPLLGLNNTQAMETLRRAMFQEGPRLGVISLIVARRKDCCAISGRESVNSMLSSSSGEVLAGWRSGSTESDSGIRQSEPIRQSDSGVLQSDSGIRQSDSVRQSDACGYIPEPVHPPCALQITQHSLLDRLNARHNLRNDSYCRATHDTSWSSPRPQLTVSAVDCSLDADGAPAAASQQQQQPVSSQQSSCNTDVAYASQTSLEQAGVGFTRDQVGRQSISEKRHASKDAKSTDTYQRTKKARDDRDRQRQQLAAQITDDGSLNTEDIGPTLGMKKSSSLESLQTMVHELAMEEDMEQGRSHHRGGVHVKVIRGRGCNESFRTAVDRSYEAPLDDARQQLETRLVVGDEYPTSAETEDDWMFSRDGATRHSSLSSGAAHSNKAKRRSTLFKGLGSMFGFGRPQRRQDELETLPRPAVEQLAGQQAQLTDEENRSQQPHIPAVGLPPHAGFSSTEHRTDAAVDRRDRLSQLREQHQRQHASRSGVYVTEHPQPRAHNHSRQSVPYVKTPLHVPITDQINNNVPPALQRAHHLPTRGAQLRSSEYFRNARPQPLHQLSSGDGSGGETRRPSSRSGPVMVPAAVNNSPPSDFHSVDQQRGAHRGSARSAGSYYEYESVQAMMRLGGGTTVQHFSNRSLPRYYHERTSSVPIPDNTSKCPRPMPPARPHHLGIPEHGASRPPQQRRPRHQSPPHQQQYPSRDRPAPPPPSRQYRHRQSSPRLAPDTRLDYTSAAYQRDARPPNSSVSLRPNYRPSQTSPSRRQHRPRHESISPYPAPCRTGFSERGSRV